MSGYGNGEWGLREALQMFHMLSNLNLGEAKEGPLNNVS